ncbi:MAG: DUF554 domain-containing protein [Treponema sp.]|nr:DUF554 domain-containing protein [Treponema sp.]
MIAVFVNCLTVMIGSLVGVFFARRISEKITDAIQMACGVVSFTMGIQMAFKYQNVVYLALALIIGGILGTIWDIDGKILAFGRFLARLFHQDNGDGGVAGVSPAEGVADKPTKRSEPLASGAAWLGRQGEASPTFSLGKPKKNFAYAFLNSSVLFCVGAMAIVGSFKAGIEHDYSTIFLKSVLDGFVSIGFAAAMGVGTLFSAIAILVYQGALTLLSVLIEPYVSQQMIAELTGSGGALIIFIGLNLMGIKKIKTANYLPAVAMSVVFVLFDPLIKKCAAFFSL